MNFDLHAMMCTRLNINFISAVCLNREEVVAALNVAIDNREEGLLLKKPTSTYQPDKRKGIPPVQLP